MDVGGRWVPQSAGPHLGLLARTSYEDTDSTVGGRRRVFRIVDQTRFRASRSPYQWTTALQIHSAITREQYNSNDWALNGVGRPPCRICGAGDSTQSRQCGTCFGLTVRYQFGHDSTPHASQ